MIKLTEEMIDSDEKILARCDEAVRGRAAIELAIVHELIKRLIAAGYSELSVDDGDGEEQTGDEQGLVSAIFAVDEARLYAKPYWVFLVMGNDGTDIVCDYHTGLDAIMDPLHDWIEEGKYAAPR